VSCSHQSAQKRGFLIGTPVAGGFLLHKPRPGIPASQSPLVLRLNNTLRQCPANGRLQPDEPGSGESCRNLINKDIDNLADKKL
jgi:hypothetical protein